MLTLIRTEVTALLLDLTVDDSGNWVHYDGHPLTDAEKDTVSSATPAECRAAADTLSQAIGEQEKEAAALGRIRALAAPYFEQLPAGSTMGDAMALMTAEERGEADRLAAGLTPDGVVIVSRHQERP
ncbi:hypothetical protein ABTX71_01685 [Streptomyces parvulus]|uniref:hypothetical protein n=1 Tax=Streptomyces parvulus TaxID=146923 RepID=UPI00332A1983